VAKCLSLSPLFGSFFGAAKNERYKLKDCWNRRCFFRLLLCAKEVDIKLSAKTHLFKEMRFLLTKYILALWL